MAEYVYINNYTKDGELGISAYVFEQLVNDVITSIPSISQSQKMMRKNQSIRLNRPVRAQIKKGIVHVSVFVDIKKDLIPAEVSLSIQKEISDRLMTITEQVPFNIHVSVESII